MVHEGVRNKLSLAFDDLGDRSLKNIAEPVKVFRVALPAQSKEGNAATDALFRRPAVAVLPLENLSGDPEQEYFADGLTEDIITALSSWRYFPVIARNSTFAYKGTSSDIRRVGEELGARYVIEGSVRKSGNRVRVTAQLINAETGHHVWAERFDRELDDIFELQDEITGKIAAVVSPELIKAETKRSADKRPENLGAWDCYLRGMACIHEYTEEANRQAQELFERAIVLDATYSRGHSGLAYSYYRAVYLRYAESRDETLAKCLATARRAVALDDADSFAHFVLSRGLYLSGQFEDAIVQAEMALALNPNDVQAHFTLGHNLISVGRPEEGIAEIELGLRLDPRDPRAHAINTALSFGHICVRRYEDAVAAARQAINQRSDNLDAQLMLASSLGHAGKIEEARATLDHCARIQPGFEAIPRPLQIVSPADIDHFQDGLRKAGWEG
jgi:adenylate cyclase